MSEFYDQVRERMIRYAKVDMQSLAGTTATPTTEKQKDLGRILREECKTVGAEELPGRRYCGEPGTEHWRL